MEILMPTYMWLVLILQAKGDSTNCNNPVDTTMHWHPTKNRLYEQSSQQNLMSWRGERSHYMLSMRRCLVAEGADNLEHVRNVRQRNIASGEGSHDLTRIWLDAKAVEDWNLEPLRG